MSAGRVLAVDPGDVRIGLAISDPLGIIARPLNVLQHRSRLADARAIAAAAKSQEARLILVGVAYDQEGEVGPQARKALRLVRVLEEVTQIPIQTWDESGSTQAVQQGAAGQRDLDAKAAAVILQEYLDAHATDTS